VIAKDTFGDAATNRESQRLEINTLSARTPQIDAVMLLLADAWTNIMHALAAGGLRAGRRRVRLQRW
jgi:hypothetical protein